MVLTVDKTRKINCAFYIILCSCLMVGCSLDYSDVYLSDDMDADIPDSILYEFTHTAVKNGIPTFRLSAGKAEVFDEKDQTFLSDVLFQEFNADGEMITEGVADSAVFFSDSENAELSGNLLFYSSAEEATFSTTYLFWNDEKNILTGSENAIVTIKRDSGTEISGAGFTAEVRTRSVWFDGPVSGIYVTEDEEDEQNP